MALAFWPRPNWEKATTVAIEIAAELAARRIGVVCSAAGTVELAADADATSDPGGLLPRSCRAAKALGRLTHGGPRSPGPRPPGAAPGPAARKFLAEATPTAKT